MRLEEARLERDKEEREVAAAAVAFRFFFRRRRRRFRRRRLRQRRKKLDKNEKKIFQKKKKKKKKIYLVDALAFLFPSGMITLKQSFPFSVSPQFSTRKVKLSSRRISVASFFPKESES